MKKSTFKIIKMDCPAEEQMIRMKLDGITQIKELKFDIPERILEIVHDDDIISVEASIDELNFNSTRLATVEIDWAGTTDTGIQRRALWIILVINFVLFVVEITTGFISNSMGLVADSIDMLADALVYGLSLYAVGGILTRKKKIAKISGYFQLSLAILGFIEVIRRFLGAGDLPVFQTMIIISLLALAGNTASLLILQRAKTDEVHMKASMIFTSNDLIANIGVILAGVVVYYSNSNIPDLIIGSLVFLLVARGALRILKLAK
jgi:Co/Zn/Cd efflux system component